MKGRLFVISAPSGTGKTTVIGSLLKLTPQLKLSVSCTTRPPRKGEKNGVDYHFVSDEKFLKMKDSGLLLEWALVHGLYYGTPRGAIDKWLAGGENVVLDIDVQGGASVRKIYKDAVLIFLLPPSHEELVKRLKRRGANTEDDLERRLKNANNELAQKDLYDYRIVNDDLDRAVGEIKKIICSA